MKKICIHGKKYKEKSEWIDMEARKVFKSGVSSSMLKCAYGYNHCGTKQKIINENKTEMCPRCSEIETWGHVI